MITFRQFISEAVDNTSAYEIEIDPEYPQHSIKTDARTIDLLELDKHGVLLNDKERKFVGTQRGLTDWLKEMGFSVKFFGPQPKEALGMIKPSQDYVAVSKSVTCRMSNVRYALRDITQKLNHQLPYTIAHISRDKANPRFDICAIIHKKSDRLEDLDYLVYPANVDAKNQINLDTGEEYKFGGKESFNIYAMNTQEVHDGDYTQSESYKYLEDHFHEMTTDKQRKNGTLQFHLGKPQNADIFIVLNSGYVRKLAAGADRLQVIHAPTGNTPEERQNNALDAAVQWVKKNA